MVPSWLSENLGVKVGHTFWRRHAWRKNIRWVGWTVLQPRSYLPSMTVQWSTRDHYMMWFSVNPGSSPPIQGLDTDAAVWLLWHRDWSPREAHYQFCRDDTFSLAKAKISDQLCRSSRSSSRLYVCFRLWVRETTDQTKSYSVRL